MIDKLISALNKVRFDPTRESVMQEQIKAALASAGFNFEKEFTFNPQSRIDFFHIESGTGIEVKISGSPKAIYRQCKKYLDLPEVNQLLLLTNKAMGMPETISGKKIRVLNTGRAWL